MKVVKRFENFSAVLVLISIFLITFIIDVPLATKLPLCFLKMISGIDCPGCGLLRSMISISHGDLREAIHFHLLGPFVYLFLFLYLIRYLFELFWKPLEVSFVVPGKKIFLTCFVMILWGQWSVRMVRQILTNY